MNARERLLTGTLVLRERRIAYASAGAAAILGREPGDVTGRVFFDFLAAEERERIADRYWRRLRGELVPTEYEMVLELPDGGRRTVEAHVSLEGRDEVVVQLRDLSDQAERRGRMLGLAELGVAIQRERSEAAIHERVREGLFDLGLAAMLVRPEAEGARVAWVRVPSAVRVVLEARLGGPAAGYLGRLTPFLLAAWEEGVAFADDFVEQASGFLPSPEREAARALAAAEALVRGLAVRLEERSGQAGCLVVAGEWLRPADVPALRLFAAQVAAALDSARAIAELSGRNFDLAALDRLGELAGGAVGLDQFLPRACEVVRATAGCQGVAVFATDQAAGRLALLHAAGAPNDLVATLLSVGLGGVLGAVMGRREPLVAGLEELPEPYRAALEAAGLRTYACVPLTIRSRALGIMAVAWPDVRGGAECRLDLLLAMGAHFAAALEADHLLGDLRRRVAELTLLNDVAADTAALDAAQLLARALRRMCLTLEVDGAMAFLTEGGGLARQAALGLSPESLALTARLEPGEGPAGLAMTRLQPVLGASDEEAGPRCAEVRRREGFQALVAVPLLAKSRAVGALCLGRRAARPFTPGEVALVSALGAQLGVAADAARQHAETERRAHDLEAISSLALRFFEGAPGDVPHILEVACAAVRRALGARQATVMLLDEEAQRLDAAAVDGPPMPEAARSIALAGSPLAAEALERGAPAFTPDTSADPRGALHGRPDLPGLALLAIPIASRDRRRGVVLVGDAPGRRFEEPDLALATALGGELAMALESAELHAEARRRLGELSLLQDVGRTLVETLELEQVLAAGVRNLARMVDAPEAYLVLLDEAARELVVQAVSGPSQAQLGLRLPFDATAGVKALCMARREPILLYDAPSDPRVDQGLRALSGLRSGLALPLLVRDKAIGAVMIVENRRDRRFTAAEVQRATAVANQLAVAVDNARAHARALAALTDLQQAQEKLLHQERLAALGELAAVVAHEVRNPLGVIFNSLGSLRRLLRPEGDARTLLDIVGEEAERLNRIVGDLLDFARPAPPDLRPERLDRLVEEAVAAALAQQPTAVEVAWALDPALPPVVLDGRQARQALLNVAANAVQAMPRGGRLTVRTRLDGESALVEVEDTGAGIPDDVRVRIFEPFFTTKATGSGLGLAVVKRIMDGHGGAIGVASRPGLGTTFTLRFPLRGAAVELAGRIG